ncbi:putative scytalone dehydratase [Dothidotthia symphoricarpi CBS 119687]|uniref:Putative scytalone dehydratase n=1 Tax=Dothidotthia symphoricarpi CBS 119687 TaxID=1392245 RepID=A0A6A6AR45_9PLEO|nr:putative scytalone dehydratase [Dothidotthia symphoricarpi CBS 119687]KAF2133648.1 putative scytalone dehydratase [Dothidotthia symphoricarpi CBS 119687]
MKAQPSFDDVLGCQAAMFEWTESYDSKDWARLAKCIAPVLRVDYRAFLNMLWEALPAEEFVTMASNPHFLGNPLLKTQHFVGASKWDLLDNGGMIGHHQMRVAHQKYTDDTMVKVAIKGHAHGKCTFAGIEPDIRWFEYDYDKIFEHDT